MPHKLSQHLRRRAREERGQAMVEFAVVLPVLILIIMFIIYFGLYMNYSNQMTQLAETGARAASVDYNPPSGASLHDYIGSQVSGELASGSNDVTSPVAVYIYYPTGNANLLGNAVRVCVVATVKYPLIGITGLSSTIADSATMRIETIDDATNPFPTVATTAVPAQCPTG